MAFTRRRFRRSRRRRTGRGKRYRRSSGGLTSRVARIRVMSHRPFGRSAGSLAPRKMYTKLENIHYVGHASGLGNAAGVLSGATCFRIGMPWAVWYNGTNNTFNPGSFARSSITDNFPLGWNNYYGLYKQFVVTGVKYHIQFIQQTAAALTSTYTPTYVCTILPVPQDPDAVTSSGPGGNTLYPSSPGQAQTAPNARSGIIRATTGTTSIVSFKGYIPLSVLQGQEIYDDRFYQNTQPAGADPSTGSSAALSGLACYYVNPELYTNINTAAKSALPPLIRASFRWYITFFDVRMFNVTS